MVPSLLSIVPVNPTDNNTFSNTYCASGDIIERLDVGVVVFALILVDSSGDDDDNA